MVGCCVQGNELSSFIKYMPEGLLAEEGKFCSIAFVISFVIFLCYVMRATPVSV